MKYITTTGSPPGFIALLVGAMLLGLISQSALAAGTTAGTTITNQATLGYTVGGFTQTPVASTASSFVVGEKVIMTVVGGVTTPATSTTAQVTPFTVTNDSNSPLDFDLTVNSVIAGDNFDPVPGCVAYADGNANGTYESGTDTALYIDELPADITTTVFVVCDIPASATNTQTGLVGLIATARGTFNLAGYIATPGSENATVPAETAESGTTVGIVIADIAGTDDTVDNGYGPGVRDAAHSARNTYQVSIVAAIPTVTKTVSLLCDPLNGNSSPKNIPGATLQYTIVVSNTSGNPVTLSTITDDLTIDGNTTFEPNLVTAASSCATAESAPGSGFKRTSTRPGEATPTYYTTAVDSDGADDNADVLTVDFSQALPAIAGHAAGELLNGESATVIFNVTVQ